MLEALTKPYQKPTLPAIQLGEIMYKNKTLKDAPVYLILKSFNRHGLIAGATGGGKTKTIQVLSEQLSLQGIPSLVMDLKGDVSGLAMPGQLDEHLEKRQQQMNLSYTPKGFPVSLFCLNQSLPGTAIRFSIQDFGSILFSRLLGLNDTQTGIMNIAFQFAKDKKIPFVDLNDCKTLLQYFLSDSGKTHISSDYGNVSPTSIASIMRRLLELESQGGQDLFHSPSFDVKDLLRVNREGKGIISILQLMNIQDKPLLFSSVMLKLLFDVYQTFPEMGDLDQPKLVLFVDEAHLIFKEANKALLSQLETITRLIRSKGVGLIFCTQTPKDVPEAILSQLGMKIQHALRAFTAKDRQAMKLIAKNFPSTSYYQTEEILTTLGIGQAMVAALNGDGEPMPLVQCLIRAPESRMGPLSEQDIQTILKKDAQIIYRESSFQKDTAKAWLERQQINRERPYSGKFPDEEYRQSSPASKKYMSPSVWERLSKNTLLRQLSRDALRWLFKVISRKK